MQHAESDVMQLVSIPIVETYSRPRRTFMRGSAVDVEAHFFELADREDVDMFYIVMCEADDSEVVHIEGLSPDEPTYMIFRAHQDHTHPDHHMLVASGLTLEEAQEHCNGPDSSGDGWMDCYRKED